MITLPSTLTTVDLQHGYRSAGLIQWEHARGRRPRLGQIRSGGSPG